MGYGQDGDIPGVYVQKDLSAASWRVDGSSTADQLQRLIPQWSRHRVMTKLMMEMERSGFIGETLWE